MIFCLNTFCVFVNVFLAEPNKTWRLKSCKGLELTYKTVHCPSWTAILAWHFIGQLAFHRWESSLLVNPNWDANSQSLALENVKPRWPPMEGNFVRQFQSPTWACALTLVSHATFYVFWRFFFEITRKTCLQNIEMSLRIWNIIRQSQTELQVIYFYENNLPNWRETS